MSLNLTMFGSWGCLLLVGTEDECLTRRKKSFPCELISSSAFKRWFTNRIFVITREYSIKRLKLISGKERKRSEGVFTTHENRCCPQSSHDGSSSFYMFIALMNWMFFRLILKKTEYHFQRVNIQMCSLKKKMENFKTEANSRSLQQL